MVDKYSACFVAPYWATRSDVPPQGPPEENTGLSRMMSVGGKGNTPKPGGLSAHEAQQEPRLLRKSQSFYVGWRLSRNQSV